MPDIAKAQSLLTQAADLYAGAVAHADQFAQFETRRDKTVKVAVKALDATHPALAEPLKTMMRDVASATTAALAQNHTGAAQLLDTVMVQVGKASQLLLDAQASTSRLRSLKKDIVPGLTTHVPPEADPVIGTMIGAMTPKLAKIQEHITKLDYVAALAALDEVETSCASAALKKQIKGGGLTAQEMTDQFKALVEQPNGAAALDDMVKGLSGDNAVDAVLAAMKARFKLDDASCLGDGDNAVKTKELCQLYTVMTRVPDKHTKDNPSFKKITRRNQDKGSDYDSSQKAINMGEGHPDTSGPYNVAKATEVPDVDVDCQPKPGTPTPKFFDWNTLHEIGHAMDDRKQFMTKNAGKGEYGGWISHGGDVLAVAKAAADALALPGVTEALIAKYLDSGTEPAAPPAGWPKVKTWADSVRHKKDPWAQGAKCGQSIASGGFLIGTRVFHEGYANTWFSYEAAARKQAITGYQFRAPGEWFSELYAAYKSDKLKDSHPAKPWLDKLFAA